MGRSGWTGKALLVVVGLSLPAFPAPPAYPALQAQAPIDAAVRDLSSSDADTRLRAARLLKDAAYLDAAPPLAALVNDPQDEVQLEAIAAELNIFLAEKIVSRKRVGLIVEVRNAIAAEVAFSSGPFALGSHPVPLDVLAALRQGARDNNPRVGLESLYAFGTLAAGPSGAERRELLRVSGPHLAPLVGAADPALRYAAVRVLGRVFEKRPQDEPIEETVGDAVITVLNDRDTVVKTAAMQALGAMRYERSVQALTDLFQYYGKGDIAVAALDAIARIAHPSGTSLLAAQLGARSIPLRGVAIEGLARLGDSARLPDIEKAAAGERNEALLLAAAFASATLANGSIEAIVGALSRPRLRDQAKAYLVELAPGRVSVFGRHAQDPDARRRADVVEVLGVAGDPAALTLVEPLLKDSDPQVARAAERAVARLRRVGATAPP